MAKSVTKIPQTRNIFTAAPITGIAKRKVAGYARVSTDSDEQFTSYEAQVDYYTRFIQSHPDWEFVKVYTDEGISGTDTRHREGFNEMIEDALAGKIDLIVTKSVSRFARNTVDSLVTIRKLKEHGCECYFEKENIFTFDGKGCCSIQERINFTASSSRSAGIRNVSSSCICNMGLSHGRSGSPRSMRAMPIFRISAAVPWIGVFSAHRSAKDFCPHSSLRMPGR